MRNYFSQNKDTFEQSEKRPELVEKLLSAPDIGITCGYLSEYYKSIKNVLKDKNRDKLLVDSMFAKDKKVIAEMVVELQVNEQVISSFISKVEEVFYDLLDNLLNSLHKHDAIQDCSNVLIGKNKNKPLVVLSDSEKAQYELIKKLFWSNSP